MISSSCFFVQSIDRLYSRKKYKCKEQQDEYISLLYQHYREHQKTG